MTENYPLFKVTSKEKNEENSYEFETYARQCWQRPSES